jgi:hypothetical protein
LPLGQGTTTPPDDCFSKSRGFAWRLVFRSASDPLHPQRQKNFALENKIQADFAPCSSLNLQEFVKQFLGLCSA